MARSFSGRTALALVGAWLTLALAGSPVPAAAGGMKFGFGWRGLGDSAFGPGPPLAERLRPMPAPERRFHHHHRHHPRHHWDGRPSIVVLERQVAPAEVVVVPPAAPAAAGAPPTGQKMHPAEATPVPPDPRGPLHLRSTPGSAGPLRAFEIGKPLPSGLPHVALDWSRYGFPEPSPGRLYARVGRAVLLIVAGTRVVERVVVPPLGEEGGPAVEATVRR